MALRCTSCGIETEEVEYRAHSTRVYEEYGTAYPYESGSYIEIDDYDGVDQDWIDTVDFELVEVTCRNCGHGSPYIDSLLEVGPSIEAGVTWVEVLYDHAAELDGALSSLVGTIAVVQEWDGEYVAIEDPRGDPEDEWLYFDLDQVKIVEKPKYDGTQVQIGDLVHITGVMSGHDMRGEIAEVINTSDDTVAGTRNVAVVREDTGELWWFTPDKFQIYVRKSAKMVSTATIESEFDPPDAVQDLLDQLS